MEAGKPSILSSAGIAALALAVSALYILGAAGLAFFSPAPASAYYYYSLASLFVLAGAALHSLRSFSLRRPERARLIGFLPLLLLALAAWALYRRPLFLAYGIWFDEITQFFGSRFTDPAVFAATQQQPPVDYFLSNLARVVGGASPGSILFHALVFGISSFGVFILWLRLIRLPPLLAPVPLLLFAGQHVLLQYSSEARPVSIGVFFALLTLLFLYDGWERGRMNTTALFASSGLLFFSMSLQPFFFLGLLALPLLALGRRREARKALVAGFLLPALLFFPALYFITHASVAAMQFRSLAGRWEAVLASLRDFYVFENSFRYGHLPVLGAFLLAAALGTAGWARGARGGRAAVAAAAGGLVYYLAFPVSMRVIWSAVNWGLWPHYFVLWPAGVIAIACLAVALGFRSLLLRDRWKEAVCLALTLTTVPYLHRVYIPHHEDFARRVRELKPEWGEVVALAEEGKYTLFIELPYAKFSIFALYLWHNFSSKAYERPGVGVPLMFNSWEHEYGTTLPMFRISRPLESFPGAADVFFLFATEGLDEEAKTRLLRVLSPRAKGVHPVRGYLIFRMGHAEDPVALTKATARALVESGPGDPRHFYLGDGLLSESLWAGDARGARHYLGLLQRMDARDPQDEGGELEGYLDKRAAVVAELERKTKGTRPALEGEDRK